MSDGLMRSFSRGFRNLIELLAGLLPLAAVAYIATFQNPAWRFEDFLFHELAIGLATLFGTFLSFVAWRCYEHTGERFLRWMTLGFLGFTLIYLMHGVFTRHAHQNLWLFLLYGPVSRLAMAGCLLAGTLGYARPIDRPHASRNYWLGWIGAYCAANLLIGIVANSALPMQPVRITLETLSLVLYLASLALTMRKPARTRFTTLYQLALACFAWSSVSFLLGKAWDHQWWLAHGIFATGFLVLGYGVVRAFLSSGSFETMFSEEQLLAELEAVNTRLTESNSALARKNEAAETASHQFESLFALAPDAVLLVGRNGRIVKANARATALFGYSARELAGMEIEALMPAEHRNRHVDARRNYQSSPEIRPMSTSRMLDGLRSTGETFPVEISLSPLSFDGKPCTMAVVRDVSQQKAAQVALQESEDLFRNTIDFAPVGMAIVGLDGSWLRVNRALCEILGYPEDELVMLNFRDMADTDEHAPLSPCLDEMLDDTRQSCQMNKLHLRKDGSQVWISLSSTLIRHQDGTPRCFIVQVEDITERIEHDHQTAVLMEQLRNAQAFADRIIAESPHGIITYRASGACMQANAAAARLVGGTVEALLEQNFHHIPSWRESGAYEAAIRALTENAPEHIEVHFVSSFGQAVWLEMDFIPFENGSERHLLVILSDVSAFRKAEQSLRDAKHLADRASQAKSDFLANMSHEIRTPMNAIMGLAYLLRAGRLDADQRDYVTKIDVASRTLLSIINDILDFSKIESGRMELSLASFSLGSVLDELATIMSASAHEKKLELIVGAQADVPARFIGDALRIEQILINLAGNAIKFTEHGHIAVEVSLVEREAGRARLRFSVIDTGIGIAADKLEHIFQSFTQADASVTRLHGGSGLGLSISKRLVELMGGEIGVSSQPGQGSEFWFSIPLELDLEHADHETATPALEVLLADDHSHALRQLANTARSLGWRAQEAESGARALTLARQRLGQGLPPYDAIVLDLDMPDMDGLAACRAIRNSSSLRDTAVVLMAAAGQREEILHSPDAQLADVVLSKPVTASSLYNAVLAARAGHELQAAPQPAPEAGQPRLSGLGILVVDDSDINQMVARRILELDGACVSVAGDGQEAIDCLRSRPDDFDLVLMDVQMPVLDGLSATRRIRGELGLKDLPVIALTAGATDTQREQAIAAGMNEFISKPFEAQRMIEVIRGIAADRIRHAAPQPAPAAALESGAFPDIDGIDTADAGVRLGHDRELFLLLLDQFLLESADTVELCRADLARGDTPSARKRVHKLRGTAANLSARRIFEQSSELEEAFEKGIPEARANELLDRLELSLNRLRASAEVRPG